MTQTTQINLSQITEVFPKIASNQLPQIKNAGNPMQTLVDSVMTAYNCDQTAAQARINNDLWNPLLRHAA